MIQVSHRTLYALSGAVWLAIGIMLLRLGLSFLAESMSLIALSISLIVGILKGRFVMQKAAMKTAARIRQLENPTKLTNLYTPANLALIAIMMVLGMSMKFLDLPSIVRGSIDTAVGAALIQGSLAYFHLLFAPSDSTSSP